MLWRLTTRKLCAVSSHKAKVECWSVSQRRDAPGLLTPCVRFPCAFSVIKEILRRAASPVVNRRINFNEKLKLITWMGCETRRSCEEAWETPQCIFFRLFRLPTQVRRSDLCAWGQVEEAGLWLLGCPRPSFRTADWTLNLTTTYPAPLYVCVFVCNLRARDKIRVKWLSVTNRSREWQKWKACLSSQYCSKFSICIYLFLCLFIEHEISKLYVAWVHFTNFSVEVLVFEEVCFVRQEVSHVHRSCSFNRCDAQQLPTACHRALYSHND